MRAIKFALAIVPALVTVLALTAGVVGANQSNGRVSLGDVRAATARYNSLSVAKAHKYAILKDAQGIACIDNPGVGAMGVHYVNGDLVGTTEVNPLKPEALVYEPQKNGHLVWSPSNTSPSRPSGTPRIRRRPSSLARPSC